MTPLLPTRLRQMLAAGVSALALAPAAHADEAVVLVQLNDYTGPEAYFHLYLVNPEGRYDRTLWVSGPERIWWPDSQRWYGYWSRSGENLDAITGASTPSGGRAVMRVEIDPELIDAGYSLRVETSVENADNVQKDAEVELSTGNQRARTPGTGYVRYIRYRL